MKKSAKKNSQKKIILIGAAGLVCIVLVWWAYSWSSAPNLEKPSYVLRTYDASAQGDHISLLNTIPDNTLTPFRCTMQFINNGENKYFWRLTTQHDLFDEVQDTTFLSIIHAVDGSLPEERMLISGRFCETQDETMYVDYYTADRASSYAERGYYNGSDVEGYIARFMRKTGEHTAPLKFISQKSWPYTGCKEPLQITSEGIMYLSCGVVEAYDAVNMIYEINIPAASVTELQRCTYNREEEFKKTCTTNNSH